MQRRVAKKPALQAAQIERIRERLRVIYRPERFDCDLMYGYCPRIYPNRNKLFFVYPETRLVARIIFSILGSGILYTSGRPRHRGGGGGVVDSGCWVLGRCAN